ncbi:MAG: hypothetical protein JXQ67_09615 [Campylobacterales bacterium]|nr:hypothetical protein [Campylobacterales bacterium]
MGGFAGGDEAGFWDEELFTLSAKEKQTKSRERIITVGDRNYTLSLSCIKEKDSFISGIVKEQQTDFKALYKALLEYTNDEEIEEFFQTSTIHFIPTDQEVQQENDFTFLAFLQDTCNLILTEDELREIARKC